MTSSGVSPAQGYEPIAKPSVTAAPVHSLHRSRPVLFSQYRGPLAFNMAETDEERKAREDKEKQTNFDKVREKAEREEEARKKAEARAEEAEKKLKEREAKEKQAEEDKLKQNQEFEKLAKDKEAEANAKAEEAQREKSRADALEAKVKAFEDEQQKELDALLKDIPEEKHPPLDPADPVAKRLSQVKHVKSLLDAENPKPPIGTRPHNNTETSDRREELKKKNLNSLTPEESLELLEPDPA